MEFVYWVLSAGFGTLLSCAVFSVCWTVLHATHLRLARKETLSIAQASADASKILAKGRLEEAKLQRQQVALNAAMEEVDGEVRN